jgi:hypothetical protein
MIMPGFGSALQAVAAERGSAPLSWGAALRKIIHIDMDAF